MDVGGGEDRLCLVERDPVRAPTASDQSVVFVDDGVVFDAVDGEVDSPSAFAGAPASSVELEPLSAPSEDDSLVEDGVVRRSFLAQPEPLKWNAGAVIALRTGPDAAQRARRRRVVVDAVDRPRTVARSAAQS